MPVPEPTEASRSRIRRARREDVAALLDLVGGPPVGRARALRRLQKTLASDLYVLERDGAIAGVVSIAYRRSLPHGGLVATIDDVRLLGASLAGESDGAPFGTFPEQDLEQLLECAVTRAARRGCVAIDTGIADPAVVAALAGRGFAPVAAWRVRSLRTEARDADAAPEEG